MANPVFIDRGIGDVVSEKEQLGFDSRCSLGWIFPGDLTNQLNDYGINLRPTTFPIPGLPSPEQLESIPVPANHCSGLHDDQ